MSENGNSKDFSDRVSKGLKSIFKFKHNKQSKKDGEAATPRTSKSSDSMSEEKLEVNGPITSTEGLPTRPPRRKNPKMNKKVRPVEKKVDIKEEHQEIKTLNKEKEKSEGNNKLIPCENLMVLETDILQHNKDEAFDPKNTLTDHKQKSQNQIISRKQTCPDPALEFKGEANQKDGTESRKYSVINENLIDLETDIQNLTHGQNSSKQRSPDTASKPKQVILHNDETESRKLSVKSSHENKNQNEEINRQKVTENINNSSAVLECKTEAKESIMSITENKNQKKMNTVDKKSILSTNAKEHQGNENQNTQSQGEQFQTDRVDNNVKEENNKTENIETKSSVENNKNNQTEKSGTNVVRKNSKDDTPGDAEQEKLLEEATENLKKIQKEMEEIRKRVESFKGITTDSDEYYYLDETMTNIFIKLDNVPSKSIPIIREARRKQIKYCQTITKMLDQKI